MEENRDERPADEPSPIFTPWGWTLDVQVGVVALVILAGILGFIAAIALEETFLIKDGFFR